MSGADEGAGLEPVPSTALDWAARYIVAGGLNPIPLRPRDKRPAVGAWKRFQSTPISHRSTDELDAYVLSWWGDTEHGIGLATGRAFDLVVVDVDGPEARELVLETCGRWPSAGEVATSKGVHLYFAHPGSERPNRAHIGGVPLDVRADGGYVVAPPSIHPSGHVYRWTRWVDPPFPPMPPALVGLCWPERRLAAVPEPARSSRYAEVALDREVVAVRQAPVGSRNDRLNAAAFALARFCLRGELAPGAVVEALLGAAIASGLPETEARMTIASAFRARRSA